MFQALLNSVYNSINFICDSISPWFSLPGFVLHFLPGFIHYCLIINRYFPISLAFGLILSCIGFEVACANVKLIIYLI